MLFLRFACVLALLLLVVFVGPAAPYAAPAIASQVAIPFPLRNTYHTLLPSTDGGRSALMLSSDVEQFVAFTRVPLSADANVTALEELSSVPARYAYTVHLWRPPPPAD